MSRAGRLRSLGEQAALFALYAATARLGLGFDAVSGVATTVWPPTGIALAALLLFGARLWPAIALAALFVNRSAGVPWVTAFGIAVGNTLEALLGAWLLRRVRGFSPSLTRLEDVLQLALRGALLSTLVSATFGVASLRLGGIGGPYGLVWRTWWIGDVLGDLLVAPLLLAWSGARPRGPLRPLRVLEALALGALLVTVNVALFHTGRLPPGALSLTYASFPLLIWAALRFGQKGAVVASFATALIAIWGTATGHGPFAAQTRNEGLLYLQSFHGVVALTVLILGAATEERLRAIRLRDDFLSIASHELKTPLTSLTLNVQGLLRQLRRGSAPEDVVERRLAGAERQIGRLAVLVDELLDVSRLDVGRLLLTRETLDCAALVREVAGRLQGQLVAAGCALELHAEQPVIGSWDRLRLEQVVTNLLTNAIKFGGGQPISVRVLSHEKWAELVVSDRGAGIAEADQGRIFERFERAASARHVGGLGLGLYIVRQIVEAHGGVVQVSSRPGQGATFTVGLPTA